MAVHRLNPTLHPPHRKAMKIHRIILNQTLWRAAKRLVGCAFDPSRSNVLRGVSGGFVCSICSRSSANSNAFSWNKHDWLLASLHHGWRSQRTAANHRHSGCAGTATPRPCVVEGMGIRVLKRPSRSAFYPMRDVQRLGGSPPKLTFKSHKRSFIRIASFKWVWTGTSRFPTQSAPNRTQTRTQPEGLSAQLCGFPC